MKKEWNLISRRLEELQLELFHLEVSESLSLYLVAGEDHRFWTHFGVDPVSLVRAFWQSIFKGTPQGGSTIAMQLVRTITGNYKRTLPRKLKEILLAVILTRKYPKEDIIKFYLGIAYFGWNMHGLEQACRFLGKKCSQLNEHDAASIIARLKYPQTKKPNHQRDFLIKRRTQHLILRHKSLISRGQYGAI